MKRSGSRRTESAVQRFSRSMGERFDIVRASVIYNFQIETAYFADFWGNMVSTLFYIIATIIFVDVLYANVDTIASYSRAEMLLYIFVGQIGFYTLWGVSYTAIDALVKDVKNGDLDLILLKPIPVLFYLETRKIHIVRTFRDAIAPTIVISLVVPWAELQLEPTAVAAGILIALVGYVCMHIYMLLFSLPVFWIGESQNIFGLAWTIYTFTDGRIPYEGFNSTLKVVFSVAFPLLWATGISASVMLGKSDALTMFLASIAVLIVFMLIRTWAWRKAMIAYSSASS